MFENNFIDLTLDSEDETSLPAKPGNSMSSAEFFLRKWQKNIIQNAKVKVKTEEKSKKIKQNKLEKKRQEKKAKKEMEKQYEAIFLMERQEERNQCHRKNVDLSNLYSEVELTNSMLSKRRRAERAKQRKQMKIDAENALCDVFDSKCGTSHTDIVKIISSYL